MERLMKIWLVLFTVYLVLFLIDMLSDRNYGRYVSLGQYRTDFYLETLSVPNMEYKILDKRTGKVTIK